MIKRAFIIFLIFTIVATGFVVPTPNQSASAATGAVANTVSCYVSGKISADIKKEMDKKKKELMKKFSGLFHTPTPPPLNISQTVPVEDKKAKESAKESFDDYIDKYITKNYQDNVLARCLTREILRSITENMENIVRTRGRDGGSAAVKNWIKFITEAQYRGENIFRAELSTAKLCGYLSDDFKKSFGVDPKKKTPITKQNTRTDSLQSFGLTTKCTMPADFTLDKYQNDFVGNGGWDAFSRMLEPQNNIWGLMALSNDEIAKQRTLQKEADTSQVIANKGYLGISGNGKNDSCSIKGPTGECLFYKDIKTTGTYLAEGLAAGLNAEYSWLTSGDAIGSVIEKLAASLTQSVINKFMNFNNPDQGGAGSVVLPTTTPGVPIPPEPAAVCFTNEAQRESIKSILSETLTRINQLGVNDFQKPTDGPLVNIRVGQVKIMFIMSQLTTLYEELFNLEKTITGSTNGELKQLIQSQEDTIKSIIAKISDTDFAWRDTFEKISVERDLADIKTSVQAMITLLDSIGICGQTPPGGPTPPGGGGVCADPGNTTADYVAQLSTAENTVLTNNPTLAEKLNDIPNSTEFVNAVARQLITNGFQASGNVLNGNGVLHTENYVAVWQSGDITIERYEVVNHAGDGGETIRNAAQAEYSGDIPMSCAN